MKKIITEYIPFEHDNLDLKNRLIQFARDQAKTNKPEGIMAAALIYGNVTDYIASNLIKTFRELIYWTSYYQFSGTLFQKMPDDKKLPKMLGDMIKELENFEFPDHVEFIKCLRLFKDSRNNLFHRLFTLSEEKVKQADQDFVIIKEQAELILQKYNAISQGIAKQWSSILAGNQNKTDA